ncbi:unnamed protein product [Parnassius apollo]|uniref:(apollo) hypothetical protein n=1 Tax=Parnassius apollo TaxID=110799 RepID=A0A8S3WMU6_PARAO|nr:unnamed protein product [Parnassius apollo]
MFYVMAKLLWNYPNLRRVVWNYSEKGHGKGAPDGVGGVLKRTADQIVAQENDIPNIEALISHLKIRCPGVSIEEIVESGILEKELLIPSDLKEFRGTMAVHQAIWSCNNPEVLAIRRLSCDMGICSEESVQCSHGQHIGFYIIGNTALSNNTYPSKMRKKNATAECSRISFGISIYKPDHGLDEISVEDRPDINIPSDDSFWTDVSSMNKNLTSTTMTKTVLTALHCEDDDSSSDYNIF